MAAAHVIVAVVFNVVVFVIGSFGNGLVAYVYTVKPVQSSTTIFIRSLALSDLLVCFLRLGAIYHWTHETNYTIDFLCPLFLSSSFFSVFSSVLQTVTIAVDRFYAVCRVGRKRITPFLAKIISAGCISAAVFMALPALYVYGTITIPPHVKFCGARHPVPILVVQRNIICILYVTSLTIISVMYIRVFVTIRSKAKVLAQHRVTDTSGIGTVADLSTAVSEARNRPSHSKETDNIQTKITSISSDITIEGTGHPNVANVSNVTKPIHHSMEENNLSSHGQQSAEENTGTLKIISEAYSKIDPRLQATAKGRLQRRTTFMLLMTTVILFLTWLPPIIVRFLPRSTRAAIMNKSEFTHTLLIIGEYLFLINNAINPVIYAFVNRRFRDDCTKVFQSLKRRFLGIILR